MALTELAVRKATGKAKTYVMRDSRNLYLQVEPTGNRYWIVRHWEGGKEARISLGPYPLVSLKDARQRRDDLFAARAAGQPIGNTRDKTLISAETLESVSEEWLTVRMASRAESYLSKIRLRLIKYVYPAIGSRNLSEITSGDILRLCRVIESGGHIETARRVRGLIGQIFRYGIACGIAETDPTIALAGALSSYTPTHYATIRDRGEMRGLLAAMVAYPYPVVRAAMLLSIHTFCRPGEIRRAEWSEIEGDLWRLPAEKMKSRREHLVPLSQQARAAIDDLRPITGTGRYLFPSARNDGRPLSENGVRVALRSMGFDTTPHGFRAMASTMLNEYGFPPDVIERQLAHVEKNKIRAAYNHAEYLIARIEMMQWWSDYLEGKYEGRAAKTLPPFQSAGAGNTASTTVPDGGQPPSHLIILHKG